MLARAGPRGSSGSRRRPGCGRKPCGADRSRAVAGMLAQDVVLDGIALSVEDDAVDGTAGRRIETLGVATWSASIRRRSSFTGESPWGWR